MVQTKRKTSIALLAVLLCLVLVLGVAQIVLNDTVVTAQAAGTRTLNSITIADMYANKDTGTYGNFSWDPSKLKEITSTSFTIKASVAAGYQPFYICWTKPAGTAYPSKLNYGYTIGADVNGDSAGKTWESSFPSDVSVRGKTYSVGEVSLSGNYDKIYFCMGHNYSYADLVVTSITFQPKVNTVKVTATAGTGVQSVYLSKDQNATSGSSSGTDFDKGDTVYAFATLAEGYKRPNNNWTLVSGTADTAGAIYRVSSNTMGTSDYNFGTINATAKTKSLTRNTNGGGYMSAITLTYGQTANLTVPSRTGYSFLGWNTNAEGTGATYGNGSAAELTALQVNAIINDNAINTVYAMWKIGPETVVDFIDAIPDPVVYTQDCKDAIDAARGGYNDLSGEEKALVTNYEKLTDAEATYNAMQSDKEALDAYKIEKKADADSLGTPSDSAACGTLIANAKSNIDAVVYDCTKTLAENKAMADDIITALESDLYNQRQADGVAEYIDAISDPVTLASKPDIDTARALYDGLSDGQKALVGNYDKLTDAEAAYADILTNCEAKIGNVYYMTLLDAFTAAAEDATVTINKDYSISGRGDPYVNVNKDVTIDLAGRTLTIGQGTIVVTEGAVLSIRNSAPATGGIKGMAGVDPTFGAYVLLYDCRLVLNAETVKQYATINHIAKGYLVEDLNGGDADENGYYSIVRPIAVEEVIGAIEAIDDPVVYTDDCKAKIDKARALYDGLEAEAQAEVTNYETLTDAEATYDGMHSDKEALDAYKVERKGDADDLALEGDSVACEQLISDAKAAVDAVVYDCTKTLAANKAVVDAIIDALDSDLALQRDKEAFEAYKPTKKGAADALALEGDSAACEDMIADAKADIDALTYDEDKDLAANKALLDGIVADLADALDLQRDKEAFDAYKDPQKGAADALGEETDSTACKDLIKDAKAAIDDLDYDEEKDLAANKALLDGIVSDLADALDLQRDKEAFDVYKDPQKGAADALGEESDSTACKDLIKDAKADIDALTYDEDKDLDANKALLDDIVADLADALTAERNEEAADAVDALIDAITTPVEYPASKDAIDAARDAFDALTDEQKALVDDLGDLETAEAAYADLEADHDAADAVDALIDAITTPVAYPASKDAIDAARIAYDALTPAQKELVDNLADLEAAENDYKVAEVEALIEAIGTVEYSAESKAKIDAAIAAFGALTEEQKTMVENHVTLPSAETTYQQLEDAAKAGEVKALIAAIGEVKYPDSKEPIRKARTAYDALTASQKEIVDNYNVLEKAEQTYTALEKEAKAPTGLPTSVKITLVVCSLIALGIAAVLVFLFTHKDEEDKKKEKENNKK